MKRSLPTVIVSAAALAVAACGSGDDTSSPTTGIANGSTSSEAAASATTVELVNVDAVGEALADAQGRVLYTSDEEAADPNVVCTDACEEFWQPLVAASAQLTGGPGVTDLDVTERPDGTSQVTYEGRRLYTFTQDSPGQASGDGFSDTFGGQRFTWHAAVVDSSSVTSGTATPNPPTSVAGDDYPGN